MENVTQNLMEHGIFAWKIKFDYTLEKSHGDTMSAFSLGKSLTSFSEKKKKVSVFS